MAKYRGIKARDREKLTDATTVYKNMTGKDLSGVVSSIPEFAPRTLADVEAEQAERQAAFEESAAAVKAKEDGDMAARSRLMAIDPLSGMPWPAPDEPPAAGVPPIVTSLEPDTAAVGQPSFTLRVLGSGFVAGSVIVFNGYDEPTALVSPTEVTTGVNMDVWLGASLPLPVTVRNPDGQTSEPQMFTFTAGGAAALGAQRGNNRTLHPRQTAR